MSFGFQSIAHAFAYVAQEVVRGAKAVESVLARLSGTEQVVEQMTGLFSPQAVIVERAAYAILGMALQAVHDLGDAAGQNGTNVQLDVQTVKDLQAILPAIKAQTAGLPIAK